jgi:hypothetical protein
MTMTSHLYLDTLTMPAASLGPENPLPAPRPLASVAEGVDPDPIVPAEARRYLGWGCDTGTLPYRLLDGYDRTRQPRPFKTAVLENEILRATFLLELGGRLWSLVHKPSGRELLYRNPVFQPSNFAVCNAWFSGGIEWNCGVQGHTPLTCQPIFAARLQADDGSPILRLYDFERIRTVPYQLDFSLPPGSPWLFVRVRLFNPHDRQIPLYWWTNIAVTETPDLRVLVPTDASYYFGYHAPMSRVAIPKPKDIDVTYPVRIPHACDYFFDIPDRQRPWEAALDGAGRGLVQVSTGAQRGRKLFVWGKGRGGRHWQEFLSEPGGNRYIEIQAGVARTQYECFPMPAHGQLDWLEAYGLMEADADKVHGSDWNAAWRDVDARLQQSLPTAELEQRLADTATAAARPPEEILHRGSGWGALENRRRQKAGEPPLCPPALVFDDASLGDEQKPWLQLLEQGTFPEAGVPGAWLVQDEWRALLEKTRSEHWLTWLHRGVISYHHGDGAAARVAWERSLALRRTPWVLRNLAMLAGPGEAADLWLEAWRLLPTLRPLAIECCLALIAAGRSDEVLELAAQMPAAGRLRVLEARAALNVGDKARAAAILSDKHLSMPDIREGELLLSNLWKELGGHSPLPKNLDFRMVI